jgi:hypothetical protein
MPPQADGSDLPSLIALLAEQGVRPIQSIDELAGDFWPEDESMEEFLATLEEWRKDDEPSRA